MGIFRGLIIQKESLLEGGRKINKEIKVIFKEKLNLKV